MLDLLQYDKRIILKYVNECNNFIQYNNLEILAIFSSSNVPIIYRFHDKNLIFTIFVEGIFDLYPIIGEKVWITLLSWLNITKMWYIYYISKWVNCLPLHYRVQMNKLTRKNTGINLRKLLGMCQEYKNGWTDENILV